MMMIWCWINPICISVCELYAPIAFTCSCFFFFLATTPKKIKTNCGPLKKKPETSNDFVEAERTKKEYGTWRGKGSTDDRFDLKKKRTRATRRFLLFIDPERGSIQRLNRLLFVKKKSVSSSSFKELNHRFFFVFGPNFNEFRVAAERSSNPPSRLSSLMVSPSNIAKG